MELRDEIVDKLRNLEIALNSSKIQTLIDNEKDFAIKAAFLRERTDIIVARVKLENAILERISLRLKQLESDIKAGIKDLENEVKKLKSTIDFLSIINRVTGLLAKVFLII